MRCVLVHRCVRCIAFAWCEQIIRRLLVLCSMYFLLDETHFIFMFEMRLNVLRLEMQSDWMTWIILAIFGISTEYPYAPLNLPSSSFACSEQKDNKDNNHAFSRFVIVFRTRDILSSSFFCSLTRVLCF